MRGHRTFSFSGRWIVLVTGPRATVQPIRPRIGEAESRRRPLLLDFSVLPLISKRTAKNQEAPFPIQRNQTEIVAGSGKDEAPVSPCRPTSPPATGPLPQAPGPTRYRLYVRTPARTASLLDSFHRVLPNSLQPNGRRRQAFDLNRVIYRQLSSDGNFRLEKDSLAYFDAAHLQELVKDGEWDAAWRYVRPFSSLWEPPEGESTNQQYTDFMHSLKHNSMLHYLACRGEEGGRVARSTFQSSDGAKKSPKIAQEHALYRSMASERARYLIKSIAKHT